MAKAPISDRVASIAKEATTALGIDLTPGPSHPHIPPRKPGPTKASRPPKKKFQSKAHRPPRNI